MTKAARPRRVLVLGGARSGKSTFAERLASEMGGPVTYVAVATASDDPEMVERIRLHRERRPGAWGTIEEPLRPSDQLAGVRGTVLVEDLTLLLSNLMGARAEDADPLEQQAELAGVEAAREVDGLMALEGNLVLVSSEVGMGLVPPHPVSRAFRDALGRLNQYAAAAVDEVYLVVAGLPVIVKKTAVT